MLVRASAIDFHSRVRARTDSPGFGRGVDMGVNGYESLMAPAFYMILKSENRKSTMWKLPTSPIICYHGFSVDYKCLGKINT